MSHLRQFVVPCAGLSYVLQVTWSHQTAATKAKIIASQRLFRSSFTSYLLHGVLSSPAQLYDSEEDETSHADPHIALGVRLHTSLHHRLQFSGGSHRTGLPLLQARQSEKLGSDGAGVHASSNGGPK